MHLYYWLNGLQLSSITFAMHTTRAFRMCTQLQEVARFHVTTVRAAMSMSYCMDRWIRFMSVSHYYLLRSKGDSLSSKILSQGLQWSANVITISCVRRIKLSLIYHHGMEWDDVIYQHEGHQARVQWKIVLSLELPWYKSIVWRLLFQQKICQNYY